MRPWYVQAADLSHRVIILGIIGYSGYLCYGTGVAIWQNIESKKIKAAKAQAAGLSENVSDSPNN